MPLRVPHRAIAVANGQAPQNRVGVGYIQHGGGKNEMGFPAPPFVVVVGTPVVSDPLWVPGFDNFMMTVDTTGSPPATTTSFEYQILDPGTLAVLVTRTILLGAASPAVTIMTFGASSSSAPVATRGDCWITFQLRISAGVGNQTINEIRLWCGVR
jgi:hypothetical protein